MKKILFRAKASGHVIELMRFDKPGPNQGDSLTRDDTGTYRYRPAGTDVVVRGTLVPRETGRRGVIGKALKPRGQATFRVGGMESAARRNDQAPAPARTQMVKTGRGGAALADRGKVAIEATAGWFGKAPSKPLKPGMTEAQGLGRDNARLRASYKVFGLDKDAHAIASEMKTATTKGEYLAMRKLLRESPSLLRLPKPARQG